jgi:hypothetical protein
VNPSFANTGAHFVTLDDTSSGSHTVTRCGLTAA